MGIDKISPLNSHCCYVCSRCVTPDRDVHYELAKKLFGEQKISTHPVPEYMELGEIPRYFCGIILVNVIDMLLYVKKNQNMHTVVGT